MRENIVWAMMVLLFSTTVAASYPFSVAASPTTIRVPQDYLTIQGAINAAASGDTIIVSEGTYAEGQINVTKGVKLLASGAVIVDGLKQGDVFYVAANNVTICGFTIINSRNGSDPEIYASGIKLEYRWACSFCIIANNTLVGHEYGIYFSCWKGVITNNYVEGNRVGIRLFYARNISISQNTIRNNSGGISMEKSCYNVVEDNFVTGNIGGIIASDISDCNDFTCNYIAENGYGILMLSSSDNFVYHNNFVNNTQQTEMVGNQIWDDGYPSGGNYWSDYNGTDVYSGPYQNVTGDDGIGDTPYVIDSENRDRYPLMNPYSLPSHVPADVNMDGVVDIFDLVTIVAAFGSKPGDPNWNWDADIVQDYIIDIFDLVAVAMHFGETYT